MLWIDDTLEQLRTRGPPVRRRLQRALAARTPRLRPPGADRPAVGNVVGLDRLHAHRGLRDAVGGSGSDWPSWIGAPCSVARAPRSPPAARSWSALDVGHADRLSILDQLVLGVGHARALLLRVCNENPFEPYAALASCSVTVWPRFSSWATRRFAWLAPRLGSEGPRTAGNALSQSMFVGGCRAGVD